MLEIRGFSKAYGPVVAADDVSLTVPPGRIVGFVGPNGAGKSTTMRAVFGLVETDAGTITWDGEPVGPHLHRFGYMPEQRGLYPKMKIAEQVAFFAQLKQVDRSTARRRAEELLAAFGLAERLDDPLEKLSHGNQQRVQLAVAMASDPILLVLDEPFSGLDPVALLTLQEVLQAQVDRGVGVLFSSHQLDLVERICDDVVLIDHGRVRASGPVSEVRGITGERQVRIEVSRPNRPLAEALSPFHVLSVHDGEARVRVTDDSELDRLLASARRAGQLIRFDYDLPSLEDVFTQLVAGALR